MLKKTILLSLFAVSLTGCVVAPFDDHPRGSYGYDHRDGDYRDRDQRPNWHNGKDRPNMHNQQRPNGQSGQRPHWDNGKHSSQGQHDQHRP